MKIVHVNTYDQGGAFNAAYRLHRGLVSMGYNSHFLCLTSVLENRYDDIVYFIDTLSGMPKIISSLKYRWFSHTLPQKPRDFPGMVSYDKSAYIVNCHPIFKDADVIHLHWVSKFIHYNTFFRKVNSKLFWTLHDMNPFMGIFHYSTEAKQVLPKWLNLDLSVKKRKQKYLSAKGITVIGPSKWILSECMNSGIFKKANFFNIPYGLRVSDLIPNKELLRNKLGLPTEKKIILCVCESTKLPRKGFDYFKEVINLLLVQNSNIHIVIVGGVSGECNMEGISYTGYIKDFDLLSQYYQASDLFVIPSVEDNLPNTLLEAIAHGLPAVGFNIGGVPDLIIDGRNGFIAYELSPRSLFSKIMEILESDEKIVEMGKYSIKHFNRNFTLETMVHKHIDLYRQRL